jgi:hypothetical protein
MRKTEDFVKGQSVVVKPQVRDPDFNVDIGGWQGRIVGVRKNVVTIAWDSVTLESIPDSILTRCEQEGLDWTEMALKGNTNTIIWAKRRRRSRRCSALSSRSERTAESMLCLCAISGRSTGDPPIIDMSRPMPSGSPITDLCRWTT